MSRWPYIIRGCLVASPPIALGEETFLQFWGNRTDYHIHFTAGETQAHRGPVLPLITQLLDLRFSPFHCTTLWTGSLKLVL